MFKKVVVCSGVVLDYKGKERRRCKRTRKKEDHTTTQDVTIYWERYSLGISGYQVSISLFVVVIGVIVVIGVYRIVSFIVLYPSGHFFAKRFCRVKTLLDVPRAIHLFAPQPF